MHLNCRFSETTSRKCSCNSLHFWNSAVTTSPTAWNKVPYTFSLKHNTIHRVKTKFSFLEIASVMVYQSKDRLMKTFMLLG
jgi:hypothetical protein